MGEQGLDKPPRYLSRILSATEPGSPSHRLAWLLDELGQRFPEAYKPWLSSGPEKRFLDAIDALLEGKIQPRENG